MSDNNYGKDTDDAEIKKYTCGNNSEKRPMYIRYVFRKYLMNHFYENLLKCTYYDCYMHEAYMSLKEDVQD